MVSPEETSTFGPGQLSRLPVGGLSPSKGLTTAMMLGTEPWLAPIKPYYALSGIALQFAYPEDGREYCQR